MKKKVLGGFKTTLTKIEAEIRLKKKELQKLAESEKKSRTRWTKDYAAVGKAAEMLADITTLGTKKHNRLKTIIKGWKEKTTNLTGNRNLYRDKIEQAKQELQKLEIKLALVKEQESNESRSIDDIVAQIFALNQTAVEASHARLACLERHVFPRLIDDDGKRRSQITFTHKNGKQRVIAMTNEMVVIAGDLAEEAENQIKKFFARFQQPAEMDPQMRPLFELTQKILIQKVDFKIGEELSTFLGLELDRKTFPELVYAQDLLKRSIRREKTNSFIRIYQREDSTSNWIPVPLS